MSEAKKCDICGKLYENFDTTLSLEGPVVYAVDIKIISGKKNVDACPTCVVKYAKMYSEHAFACEVV